MRRVPTARYRSRDVPTKNPANTVIIFVDRRGTRAYKKILMALARTPVLRLLCLPQIKPEHRGDAVHPGPHGTECAPLPPRHVISARPCSTISECACHYSSPCRTAAHGADGVRRTPRYGRDIPCGSSRSTVLRMRFARVNAETSGGLECRSIERGRINISPYAPSRSRIR
jgi:hypothetical protein